MVTTKPERVSRPKQLPNAKATLEELQALWEASTNVVSWYKHVNEVRGPFCRWLAVTDVAPEYEKHVAYKGDDLAYAAAAMNNLPHLIKELQAYRALIPKIEYILKVIANRTGTEKYYTESVEGGQLAALEALALLEEVERQKLVEKENDAIKELNDFSKMKKRIKNEPSLNDQVGIEDEN